MQRRETLLYNRYFQKPFTVSDNVQHSFIWLSCLRALNRLIWLCSGLLCGHGLRLYWVQILLVLRTGQGLKGFLYGLLSGCDTLLRSPAFRGCKWLVILSGVSWCRSVPVSVLADDRLFCKVRSKNSGSVSDDGLTLPLSCCLAFSDRRKVSGLCSVLYGLGRKEAVKNPCPGFPAGSAFLFFRADGLRLGLGPCLRPHGSKAQNSV